MSMRLLSASCGRPVPFAYVVRDFRRDVFQAAKH